MPQDWTTRMMESLAELFARRRVLLIVAQIAVSVFAAVGYLPDKPAHSPPARLEAIEKIDEQPTRSEQVANSFDLRRSHAFLVVECDDLFTPEAVGAVRAVVKAVEALPIVDSVFWADRAPMLNVFGFADPLFPEAGSSLETYQSARQRILQHPLVAGQLLSSDGRTLMMPIVYDWVNIVEDDDCTELVLHTARQAADDSLAKTTIGGGNASASAPAKPSLTIGLTGNVPLYLAQRKAFLRNQWLFRVIGYSMTFLLAIVLFRGLSAVIVVSLAPALGMFWVFGLLNLFDVEINELTNVILPVLISMIGFTDGVHLMVYIRKQRAAGLSEVESAKRTIAHVGLACALTSLTTAVGFISLVLAHSEFVRSFGIACSLGVIIAFFAVVTSIPVLTCTPLGRRIHIGHEHDVIGKSLLHFDGCIDWILRRRKTVTAVGVVATLALGAVSATLRPDAKLEDSLPGASPAYQSLAHCDRAFGGIQFVQVVARWPRSLADDDPKILRTLRDVEGVFDDEPLLSHPLSIRNMLATFPESDGGLETQMTFLSLLPRDLSGFFFRPDVREAVVVLRIQDVGIAVYEPVFARVDSELRKLERRHQGFQLRLEGGPVKRSRELFKIVTDLAHSLTTASIVILMVMGVVYGSLRIGLISIIPNAFPLVATGAMLVILGRPLEIASVCAFVVCLGIAVDDTIHFLSRFQLELKTDGNVDAAIRRCFFSVGSAMIITTIVLVTGFVTVLSSDLPAHRTFAGMACSTITAALLGDMIFLPAIISVGHRIGRDKK